MPQSNTQLQPGCTSTWLLCSLQLESRTSSWTYLFLCLLDIVTDRDDQYRATFWDFELHRYEPVCSFFSRLILLVALRSTGKLCLSRAMKFRLMPCASRSFPFAKVCLTSQPFLRERSADIRRFCFPGPFTPLRQPSEACPFRASHRPLQ
jgi:hypothetical protein